MLPLGIVPFAAGNSSTSETRGFKRDIKSNVIDESCKGDKQRGVTKGNHLPASHLVQGSPNCGKNANLGRSQHVTSLQDCLANLDV
ncbi:MAG: hypothetical protein FRX49_12397 [Trebouxia sp. A1-2]|nr:MAG: hypothetical protein FRX49_13400 [Trebouxia sp. A1-2]KAA6417605.1 MAG: hypothetical protein FRX49_12397 [Trebouxia sp. A1-2]